MTVQKGIEHKLGTQVCRGNDGRYKSAGCVELQTADVQRMSASQLHALLHDATIVHNKMVLHAWPAVPRLASHY